MHEPARTSPLAAWARSERAVTGPSPVTLGILPFGGKLILRAGAEAAALASATLGFELPATMRSAGSGGVEALWLGPDEWLLLIAADSAEHQAGVLRQGLAAAHHAVVDVSDRFTGISITGTHAADVLAAGCPLDLHPRAFPEGMVTRTLLGKATIVLRRPAQAGGFDLYVNGSFAPYVWLFLENAAREYGFHVAA